MLESLVARILEVILFVKLKRPTGLKLENVFGDDFFGIREMKKALVSLSIRLVEKR